MERRDKLAVKPADPIAGSGLFARQGFASGEFIAEYTGARIPTRSADATGSRYLFEVDAEWTIEGSDPSNIARYINHSCSPNAEADCIGGRILIFASRAIRPGEEICIDYGSEYFEEFIRPAGCKCPACR